VVCQAKSTVSAADGTFNVAGLSTIHGADPMLSHSYSGRSLEGRNQQRLPTRRRRRHERWYDHSFRSRSRGQDFWLAFPDNLGQIGEIFILTDGTANYTISNNSAGFSVTDTVTAQSPPSSDSSFPDDFLEPNH